MTDASNSKPVKGEALFSLDSVPKRQGSDAEVSSGQIDEKNAESESSESSPDGDLREDLENTLSMNFNFKGTFAFGSKLPTAPNPGLQIVPLGLVGLPLSERDAQSIMSIASQAPFGHGDQLVVDTNVRHTWEIEPAGTITFANPAWLPFMESVVKMACAELGVLPSSKPPKCELYKVLLYEAGSHFLPHQDTEKSPGMFATIVIVLPSFYSGGQVHVSHGSENQAFDFSSDGFATSMLTWYADVTHEVKPITAGYRLALSYNLIQEETSFPLPSVPSANSAIVKLKSILRKWSKRSYMDAPQYISYVLDHEYSQVDLGLGEKCLKGADAHLFAILRQVAVEEGVALALAELEGHVVGSASEEYGGYGGYSKRSRCYYDKYDDEHDESPSMGEEISRTMSLSSLVDLDGTPLIVEGSIDLSSEESIPSDPFEDVDPDDENYEGYMGNSPGDVEYWYHRAVVVLYLQADVHDFLLEAGGTGYAISQLKLHDSDQPSPLDRKFAKYVVAHLKSYNVQNNLENGRECVQFMLPLAVQWQDSELWLEIASRIGAEQNLKLIGEERFIAAWEAFGFEVLRPLLEKAVAHCRPLKAQIELIDSFINRAKTEEDNVVLSMWGDEQKASAFMHIKCPVKDDVSIFINVLKLKGLHFFVDIVQPQLLQLQAPFEFIIVFVTELHKEKDLVSKSPTTEGIYRHAVLSCLLYAASQWKVHGSTLYPNGNIYGQSEKQQVAASFTRINELIDTCFLAEDMEACKALFISIIKDATDVGVKFKDYFIPIVPVLRRQLNSRNIPLNTEPFGGFFRYLIETFLVSMLGGKGVKLCHVAVRKIGCGCAHCQVLDSFLVSTHVKKEFRYNQSERNHLEQRLNTATDLASFKTLTYGKPYILEVTKHADVVAAASWEGRQKAAKKFLTTFGGDAAVGLIMGSRYPDVGRAITGERAYANVAEPYSSSDSSTSELIRMVQSTASIGTSSSPDEALRPPLAATPRPDVPVSSNIAAGTKRKSLGFIDLSGSP